MKVPANVQPIVSTVCAYLGVPQTAFHARRAGGGTAEENEVTQARWSVMLILRLRGWSYSRIARALHRDYTSVKYAEVNSHRLPESVRAMVKALARLENTTQVSRMVH